MTKLIVTFNNSANAPKNSSPARNGTPAVQLATLNAMRWLGGQHLRPVRGTKLLVAHFVTLRRRSLLSKCDKVPRCMSLQQNALPSVHRRQIHARLTALCKEYRHQISWKANKGLVADTRYLKEVRTDGRTDGSGLHVGRSSYYFVTNPQIWQQSLGRSESSLCHIVHELQHFIVCNRNAY